MARAIFRAKDAGSSKQETAKQKTRREMNPATATERNQALIGWVAGIRQRRVKVTFHVSQKLNSWQSTDQTSCQRSKNRA
ncbi:hypothetical protein AnigIFM50267_003652 [Aspergillus niger]|nr:hypothetical protein AnigIFM50267_003652 [Aspergillus niger]